MYALIPAAGRGARFNSLTPGPNKIFQRVAGKSVLRHTVDKFDLHPLVDLIVVVASESECEAVRIDLAGIGTPLSVVRGGDTRQDSVYLGLRSLPNMHDAIVLVHDAARPNVTNDLISRVIESALRYGSGVAAVPVNDTLKSVNSAMEIDNSVDRSSMWAVQTPQAFRLSTLLSAHEYAATHEVRATDESGLVCALQNLPVKIVSGESGNVKLTRTDDLAYIEFVQVKNSVRSTMQTRIGFGYDIHPFGPERRLILGGVAVPTTDGRGLLGHSDADVLVHAICDALLGAAGLPDIGVLFPNTDESYKDADSCALLSVVNDRLVSMGFSVVNVDSTVIAERPKIAPFVVAMKQRIAEVLNIKPEQVGVKATTNEGLGSLGSGLGIAAHAVAAISFVPNVE